MKRVLIVDDDRATTAGMADVVEEWGYEAEVAYDVNTARKAIDHLVPDVVLLDLVLPDGDGLDLLRDVQSRYPDLPMIILTGHASVDTAVDALKEGAEDYLTKPVDLQRLEVMLRGITDRQDLKQEVLELRRQLQKMGTLGHLVGRSSAMQRLFEEIEMVADTDANVFIVGESGSGKEVVSNTIHSLSRRKNKPFIAFNCGAISPTLIESEIFGHEKGAFTNAIKRREGYFETAKGGTVFLDEITEMPLDLQVKLLRVLEEGKFRRVGGNEEIAIDARIIAASNRDPLKAIEEGRLREDLYYRLNVFPIEVPPLRERKEDIPTFVWYFIEKLSEDEEKKVERMDPDFLEALERYDWPGNVRELRNVVNRAYILARNESLTVDSLPAKMVTGEMRRRRSTSISVPMGRPLAEIEKMVIDEVLAVHGGDTDAAAEALGISRQELEEKAEVEREPVEKPEPPKVAASAAKASRKTAKKAAKRKSGRKKAASKRSTGRKTKKKKA
ncbi:MAG: sigma-54 dependent transcriptional regulator [Acidobacteria bacterium]|nr:sigma-54 dependent transcriptional regulator [Acidobacteriota bacterium]